MQLFVRDPVYMDRLAAFLESVGQRPVQSGSNELRLEHATHEEVELYLRVWRILHPDADVEITL